MDRSFENPGDTAGDNSAPLVGIFADDLTGALDTAAPFAARGFKTLISPTHALPAGAGSAEVVSINLGTRHMAPGEIAGRTAQAVAALAALGMQVLVNKVDSTLRGNPGVELLAAMGVLSADHAVLCPTYPQNGRVVRDGLLLVDGVPVADTDVGQDRLAPLPSSEIEQIVTGSLRAAGVEDRAIVVGGKSAETWKADRLAILVPDAESRDDLRILANRLVNAGTNALVAGSAGVAVALAEVLGDDGRELSPLEAGTSGRGILVVTASQRTVVDDQIAVLGGQMDLTTVEVPVGDAMGGIGVGPVGKLAGAVTGGGVAVLKLGKLDSGREADAAELQEMAGTIVANLGRVVREIVASAELDVLIVIGGDTASGVLGACDVSTVRLCGELQPGTVSSRPVDGSLAGLLLVSRAGGFGGENALHDLVSLLRPGRDV